MTPHTPLDWRAFLGLAMGAAALVLTLREWRDHWRMP